MDHTALRVFVAVAEHGSLTGAASQLCMSQPAVSLQLKKLQSELCLVLFERNPRGMRLTDVGRKLLPAAQRAVNVVGEFSAAAKGLHDGVSGQLKIGTIVDPEFLRLGASLGRMAKRHPGLTFELRQGISGQVAQQVESGQLDVGFTLGLPGFSDLSPKLSVQPLAALTYKVIAPAAWQSDVIGAGWAELATLPWIQTPSESVHARLLSNVFDRLDVQPKIAAQVDVEPSMLDLVKSGVALSLARDNLAIQASHEHGVVVADAVELQAELGIIFLRNRAAEPAIQAAVEQISDAWGS
ncbi:MAG: LysR family transcriptional regulator [Litorivicinus sp.]